MLATIVCAQAAVPEWQELVPDDVYRVGPEVLVRKASAIAAGRPGNYRKQVNESSAGSDPMPMKWTVAADVDVSRVLKGNPLQIPFHVSVKEESAMLKSGTNPGWQAEYGYIDPGRDVVVFFLGDSLNAEYTALPASDSTRDLVDVVANIARIQGIGDREQQTREWTEFLGSSKTIQGRYAALRSLCRPGRWQAVAPIFEAAISPTSQPPQVRQFAFSFVRYGLTQKYWSGDEDRAVSLLTRAFADEGDPQVALTLLNALGVLLQRYGREGGSARSSFLHDQIVHTIKGRPTLPAQADPDLEAHYREVRAELLTTAAAAHR